MSSGFRVHDSILLQDSIKVALQIKEKIEELSHANKATPDQLPDSLIPTNILYDLAACYEAMYTMLLDLELVKTGNLKSDINNIH